MAFIIDEAVRNRSIPNLCRRNNASQNSNCFSAHKELVNQMMKKIKAIRTAMLKNVAARGNGGPFVPASVFRVVRELRVGV